MDADGEADWGPVESPDEVADASVDQEALDGWGDDFDAAAPASADAGWDEDDKGPEDIEELIAKPPALTRQESYFVMDVPTLEKRAQKLVKQTAEVLYVDEEEASCMLRHYGWKTQKLQQDWFTDDQKVRKTVGLVGKPKNPPVIGPKVQCQSAFCDVVASDQALALNCGHWFCDDCWKGYLVSQINTGRSCVFTRCMGMKCNKPGCTHKFGCACDEMVPDRVFVKYVDKGLLNKYKKWVLSNFVEGEKKVKWCPNPKCENAIEYAPGGSRTVQCTCGHAFCFACQQSAHTPAPCDLVKKWLQKEQSDDATAVWLAARTKACPKCNVRIEKNKACNHMRCVNCAHDFCWLCKGPWDSHGSATGGFYVCNKYNEDKATGALQDEEKNMISNQKILQKYRFYYNRYKSSAESIQLTVRLGEKLERQLSDTQDLAKSSYIMDAIHKLIEARRVLQWTYSMAYYLKAGREKTLFEYQQELLINQTEGLQEVMDNVSSGDLASKRHEIIDRTSTMEKFRREMVNQVENGDFEALLLAEADANTVMWGCTVCKAENKPEAKLCSCSACRLHGEMDCKACNKPS